MPNGIDTIPSKTKEKVHTLNSDKAREEILKMVDNGEMLSSYTPIDEPGSLLAGSGIESVIESGYSLDGDSFLDPNKNYKYIIITNETFKNATAAYTFQDLLRHRADFGFETDPNAIFTVEWIEAHYDGTRPDGGTDLPTKIRNFIIDAYNTWGTQYVLLGGDADAANIGGESGHNIVPARYLYVYESTFITPSDLYYACLDGSFDHNGNGIYGEVDDGEDGGVVDLMAEVFVGRAPVDNYPVDNYSEMENFVRKTIEYESNYPTDPY